MNERRTLPRFRSMRAFFLRFMPIASVILIDLFFLVMLDNLFFNKKRALILEPSELRDTLFETIDPIKEVSTKFNPIADLNQRKEQIRQFLQKNALPILEKENPWFRVELTDSDNHILFENENREKFRKWNNGSNSFLTRSFKAITTLPIRDPKSATTLLNVTFFYASPHGWPDIKMMVIRYWIYAGVFIVASWAVFLWLSFSVFRPLEKVGRAIEEMIRFGRVGLIPYPKHAIEHQFNRLARNQREVLFGLEIEGIVDELHSLADDSEVMDRFFQKMAVAISKIYPFEKVALYRYSPGTNQYIPFMDESPAWPDSRASQQTASGGACAISLYSGDLVIGGMQGWCDEPILPWNEMEAMTGEIKKQAENGLARAFTRSRTLTEERNRFGINLATNMGHDLTNIIASGKWDLDTIQRAQNLGIVTMDRKKGSFFLDAVEGLKNNLHFLQEMVNIYRSFGYTRSPRYEKTDLKQIVEQVARLFRLSTSQKLSVEVDMEEEIEMIAEPRLLRMAFFNLLANASQAIRRNDPRQHGTITVRAREITPTQIIFSIRDNGPGIRDREGQLIPANEIRRIFQSGFSTKENTSGGGLGLAWVKSIVEDFHHGTIDAANPPEGGAEFLLTLPRNAGQEFIQESNDSNERKP